MFSRTLVLAATVAAALVATSAASAATAPEVRALQRQVKTLRTQVTALKTELAALKATLGTVSAKADEAATAAAGAGQAAATAVTKTNCLVSAAALVLWNNDIYYLGGNQFGVGTGLDLAAADEPVTVYAAGVNASCVPGVFPRTGRASYAPPAASLLRHPR